MKNNRLKIFSAIVLISLLAGNLAFAESLNENTKNTGGMLYTLAYWGGKVIQFAGQLTNWALNINNSVLDSPTVKAGWLVSRNIANLGFVLFIIIMAFATILRFESYGLKNTLWKLIVVALLINFSMPLAGVLIDFSGVITNFFITSAYNDPTKIADALMNAIGPQRFFNTPNIAEATSNFVTGKGAFSNILATFGPASMEFISGLLFILVFSGIAAITMLAFAFMFILRYFWLNFLLIIMPIAWLFWIFPALADKASDWWREFIKWTFFAPAATFFLYLALFTQAKIKYGDPILSITATSGDSLAGFFDFSGVKIGGMIIIIGILLGGLITANKFGIAGADIALKGVNGMKNLALGGTALVAGGAAGWAGSTIARKAASAGADAATGKPSYAQRAANTIAKVPGLAGVAAGLNKFAQGPKQSVKEYKEQIETYTPEMVKAMLKAPSLNDAKTAALTDKAMTMKDPSDKTKTIFDNLSDKEQDFVLNNSMKLDSTKQILEARPDLAVRLNVKATATQTAEAVAVGKNVKPGKVSETLSAEAIKNVNVLLSLQKSHLKNIENNSVELQVAINDALGKINRATASAQQLADIQRIEGYITRPGSLWV